MTCHRGPGGQRLTGPRHDGEHVDEEPCEERHCRIDGHTHLDDSHPQTCPACVGVARDNLQTIAKLYDNLPLEAWHRGAAHAVPGGEAMALHAPAAHPEAWHNWAASALMQSSRPGFNAETTPLVDDGSIDANYDELHPLWVLGTWELEWRELLDQPSDLRITVHRAADYLGRHLGWAAQRHDAFDEMAEDLSRCRGYLEAVLHDGERDDTVAAPCFECGGQIVREVTDQGRADDYICRRCDRRYDVASYWLAVRAHAEREAGWDEPPSSSSPHSSDSHPAASAKSSQPTTSNPSDAVGKPISTAHETLSDTPEVMTA